MIFINFRLENSSVFRVFNRLLVDVLRPMIRCIHCIVKKKKKNTCRYEAEWCTRNKWLIVANKILLELNIRFPCARQARTGSRPPLELNTPNAWLHAGTSHARTTHAQSPRAAWTFALCSITEFMCSFSLCQQRYCLAGCWMIRFYFLLKVDHAITKHSFYTSIFYLCCTNICL